MKVGDRVRGWLTRTSGEVVGVSPTHTMIKITELPEGYLGVRKIGQIISIQGSAIDDYWDVQE